MSKSETLPSSMLVSEPPRLVLHADCTTCGRLNRDDDASAAVLELALDHTDGAGHVVVLNGTTDIPDEDAVDAAGASSVESPLPSIEEILADPSASFWLRNALLAALSRDPVDAANEAEVLVRLLDRRCREVLKASSCR
jgi:hypothetical protein